MTTIGRRAVGSVAGVPRRTRSRALATGLACLLAVAVPLSGSTPVLAADKQSEINNKLSDASDALDQANAAVAANRWRAESTLLVMTMLFSIRPSR